MSELLIEIEVPGAVILDAEPGQVGLELAGTPDVVALPVTTQESVEILSVGPAGPPGSGYIHVQSTPSSTWVVNHGLNTRPPVTVFLDSDLTEPVFTDVFYPDLGTLMVEWSSPESGRVYI